MHQAGLGGGAVSKRKTVKGVWKRWACGEQGWWLQVGWGGAAGYMCTRCEGVKRCTCGCVSRCSGRRWACTGLQPAALPVIFPSLTPLCSHPHPIQIVDPIVICGFSPAGQMVANMLQSPLASVGLGSPSLAYLAFDLDPERVSAGRKAGFKVR